MPGRWAQWEGAVAEGGRGGKGGNLLAVMNFVKYNAHNLLEGTLLPVINYTCN